MRTKSEIIEEVDYSGGMGELSTEQATNYLGEEEVRSPEDLCAPNLEFALHFPREISSKISCMCVKICTMSSLVPCKNI